MHTTAYFAMQCVVLSPPLSLATGARYVLPTNPTFILLLPAIGILGFTAQMLLTAGLQRETAGRGTLGMYIQLVFAVALEWAVFGVLPRGLSIVGMAIIVMCALYVAVSILPFCSFPLGVVLNTADGQQLGKMMGHRTDASVKISSEDSEIERGLLPEGSQEDGLVTGSVVSPEVSE
jgi:hypothetical protein